MTITTYPKTQDQPSRPIPLDAKDPAYVKVKALFEAGWLHSGSILSSVDCIFKIQLPDASMKPYQTYLNSVLKEVGPWDSRQAEQLLFHGTRRTCSLGENLENVYPCNSSACGLCGIVKKSFDVSLCGSRTGFSRFGKGIYSSSCSSKAAGYASNADDQLQSQILLVSSVIVGKAFPITRTSTKMDGPPQGNHSVLGVPGDDLNFEETIVYRNDAIRPAYLIAFKGSLGGVRKCTPATELFRTVDDIEHSIDVLRGIIHQDPRRSSLALSNSIDILGVALQLLDDALEELFVLL